MIIFSPFRRLSALLILFCALSACALSQFQRGVADHSNLPLGERYHLSGRFYLSLGDQHFVGKIRWRHWPDEDFIAIHTPYGTTVAMLYKQNALWTIRDANDYTASDTSVEALIFQTTGQNFPLNKLQRWLYGEHTDATNTEKDALKRVVKQHDDHWQVRYEYRDDLAKRANRITAQLDQRSVFKLTIDHWQELEENWTLPQNFMNTAQ